MTETPYLRIAADLRRRIASGELKPGQKVPSTRQLQEKWRVALATASRALTLLSQEGVLRAQPRFGYIVAPRRQDGVDRSPGLTRPRIVRAAIDIADEEGLAALSMRGVAARLRIPTMSIYRHVESREALLMYMVDSAFAERSLPLHGANWRESLEIAARVQWNLCRRHPWLPQIISLTRPLVVENVVKHADWVFAAMEGLSIDAATKMYVHMTLYSYVRGVAINLDAERQAESETGLTEQEWMDTQSAQLDAVATSRTLPAFARVVRELGEEFDPDLDSVFEFGLKPLLDGLARVLEGHAS